MHVCVKFCSYGDRNHVVAVYMYIHVNFQQEKEGLSLFVSHVNSMLNKQILFSLLRRKY